jgi:hypothetical protein
MMLTNISSWGSFFNVRVVSVEPPGPAIKGQRMLGEAGPRWLHLGVSFQYTLVDATNYKLELDARFPMGITVHEAMDCVPLEGERCRVNYHCNFGFPVGWRGRLTRVLLSLRLKEGPADSLMRLKRGAEEIIAVGRRQQANRSLQMPSQQLPDPASPSVTPPAKAGGAPSVAADH